MLKSLLSKIGLAESNPVAKPKTAAAIKAVPSVPMPPVEYAAILTEIISFVNDDLGLSWFSLKDQSPPEGKVTITYNEIKTEGTTERFIDMDFKAPADGSIKTPAVCSLIKALMCNANLCDDVNEYQAPNNQDSKIERAKKNNNQNEIAQGAANFRKLRENIISSPALVKALQDYFSCLLKLDKFARQNGAQLHPEAKPEEHESKTAWTVEKGPNGPQLTACFATEDLIIGRGIKSDQSNGLVVRPRDNTFWIHATGEKGLEALLAQTSDLNILKNNARTAN